MKTVYEEMCPGCNEVPVADFEFYDGIVRCPVCRYTHSHPVGYRECEPDIDINLNDPEYSKYIATDND